MCNIIKRLESRDRGLLPPSARFARIHLPRQGGFWCSANSAYSAVPLRGAIVSMGLRGVQGGLRGEIEIFPGPPAKKVIKKLPSLLFISTPQSRLAPCQLPVRGAFWVLPLTKSCSRKWGKCHGLRRLLPPYKSSASCTGFSSGDRLSVPV